ncbi:MAG: DNA primase [Nitrospinota bacterium]|nr:DNA primase [Nitrospinota bacterium]
MKHHIPESIIGEIRTRADIVEIISDHVLIKKSGQNYKGLCPFHPENTPSFVVSPTKQIYHCFGCSAGGNVFKFLMETEGFSFLEVIKKLAARYNVSLPATDHATPHGAGEREFLLQLNLAASKFFCFQLHHPAKGWKARQYLSARSFNEETIRKYQLGWAPPGWRELLTYFESQKKSSRRRLEKAGLVKQGGLDSTSFYDRFRGRIIFPLKDPQGGIIGFAGRTLLEDKKEAKYLNSPETPLYVKGNNLFGLDQAKTAIRRQNQVLIMEGYFDQMRAAQSGISHAVATGGTALTTKQAALLKNHTLNAILVFDSDAAGHSAAERGFDLLLEQGMNVRVTTLPEGHDPDSYIREQGAKIFSQLVQDAESYVEYFIRKTVAAGNIEKTSGRIEVANRILPMIGKIRNSIARTEALRLLSEQLGTEDKDLLAELRKAVEKNKIFIREPESKPLKRSNPDEYYLLHLLLSGDKPARIIRKQISLEELQDEHLRHITGLLYAMLDTGESVRVDRALDQTDQPEVKTLLTQIGLSLVEFDDFEKAAADCIHKIKLRNLKAKIKDLKQQRNDAEKAGQTERSRELHQLVREMQTSLNQDEVRAAFS